MSARRLTSNLAAALLGAIVGAVVMLTIEGATRDLPRPREPVTPPSPTLDIGKPQAGVDPHRTVLLAWTPGGLPPETERVVEELRVVQSATTIEAGLDWILSSRTDQGAVLDAPPAGYAIPFEIAFVEPREYAEYVPPSERDAILGLSRGRAVLAENEADLRGGDIGVRLRMRGGRAIVSDVVSDVATQGYEALLAGPVPSTWERIDRFVLVKVNARRARGLVERKIAELLPAGQVLRIRAQGETPFLRQGDAVLPQLHIKRTFGEFAAKPAANGTIAIDGSWRRKNVVARDMPILGLITCHRSVFPQVRAALQQISDEGLAFTIDPGDFGGCYSPRFIDSNPAGRISHHSWGIAIDLNVAQNRPGTRPDIDERVVRVMEEHGFTWGGQWLVPDGMHFEWVRFP